MVAENRPRSCPSGPGHSARPGLPGVLQLSHRVLMPVTLAQTDAVTKEKVVWRCVAAAIPGAGVAGSDARLRWSSEWGRGAGGLA